jgi:hypothetical protein
VGRLKSWLFNVYVAANMLLCAVFGFGRSLPRETISGWLGRAFLDAALIGKYRPFVAFFHRLVDRIYFWEPDHCQVTADQESEARKALKYGAE